MQFRKILLMAILCAITLSSYAQQATGISGVIKDQAGEVLPAITVKLAGTNMVTASNLQGQYFFSNIKEGNYLLVFSGVGIKTSERKVVVGAGTETRLDIVLVRDIAELQSVLVIGRTKVQEVNRQAFNVTAVDAKQLYNSTLDLSGALDRVSGVRVRESGGVGSSFNLSLNGFSGNRVRYFIDGVPMDNMGSSFQINNIPINVAERLEVYKGVVPIWLGSDALGGAINIVTGDRYRNFVDASYSYGSFNTHRSVVNAAVTTNKGLTFRLNAFQNYSDNNYKVTVEAADIRTGAYSPAAVLKRFHDTYHNETLIASAGVVGKSWADQLLLSMTMGKNYKEFQTSARLVVPYGAWHRHGDIIMPALKYRKADLIKGLDVTLNGNFNFGTEYNVDTVGRYYDWYGNWIPKAGGAERSRTLSRYRNNTGIVTGAVNYKITDHQSVAASNVYNTFSRNGTDAYNDGFTRGIIKPRLRKNVLGLAYTYDEKDKWSVQLFGKHLYQKVPDQRSFSRFGYGAAATYFISSKLQLKASYEKAQRLPEATELFGDLELQEGNTALNPESSDNANLGLSYGFNVKEDHHFLINANATYRYSDNYIYSRFNQNQTALLLENLAGVFTYGGEGEVRYSYKKWLSAGATLTYQYLQNQQRMVRDASGNLVVSPVYKDQMPNIPFLFGNADASVSLRDFKGKGNTLNLGYNLLFVQSFWLYWPSLGSRGVGGDKRGIPMQLSHDLNAVYSLKNGRYNIGLEAKNITDNKLYDNFSLQKPGRGFYLNVRYFFNSFKI